VFAAIAGVQSASRLTASVKELFELILATGRLTLEDARTPGTAA
jgi:hypothetical protein